MYKWDWAKSTENKVIEMYTSTKDIGSLQRPMILIGGLHGDEPEGVYLGQSTLHWLNSVDNKTLKDFILIPCINPDAYSKNQRVNARGVDLNRNFPSKNWSSEYTQERYFPGNSPGSEIEIQALLSLIQKTNPRLIIHFHSWKPCVVVSGPDNLFEAKILAENSGYELVQDIGYPTPGSLGEYAWHDLQLPVICTEDEEHRNYDLAWQHFGEGIKKVLLK
ncbi:MAG: DUF2817 domain-containing protein [Bdellovibrionaceae bacterium]|nr:DUF2817 domain-containing protein [Pseudobdellovibrionaceae bacterium]